ncbi:hypothetical protein ACMFMG_004174 [Clarireedia jacksonii]
MSSDTTKKQKRHDSPSGQRHRGSHNHHTDQTKRTRNKSPESNNVRLSKKEYYEQAPSGLNATLSIEPGPSDRMQAIRNLSPERSPPSPPEMSSINALSEILQLPNIPPAEPKCLYCNQTINTNRFGSLAYLQHLINLHQHQKGVVQEMREWTWKCDIFTPHGNRWGLFSSRKGMEEHGREWGCVGKCGEMTRRVFSDEMDVRKMALRKAGGGKERVGVAKVAGSGGSMGPPPRSSGNGGNSQTPRKSGDGGGGSKRNYVGRCIAMEFKS